MSEQELINLWNLNATFTDNSRNKEVTEKYLPMTNISYLHCGLVIAGRKINKSVEEYIFLVKKDILLSFVVMNLEMFFPLELSRIRHHSLISDEHIDLVNSTISTKVYRVLDLLTSGLERKFKYLDMLEKEKLFLRLPRSYGYETFYLKPESFVIPSMSKLIKQDVSPQKQTQEIKVIKTELKNKFIVTELSDNFSISDLESIIYSPQNKSSM